MWYATGLPSLTQLGRMSQILVLLLQQVPKLIDILDLCRNPSLRTHGSGAIWFTSIWQIDLDLMAEWLASSRTDDRTDRAGSLSRDTSQSELLPVSLLMTCRVCHNNVGGFCSFGKSVMESVWLKSGVSKVIMGGWKFRILHSFL